MHKVTLDSSKQRQSVQRLCSNAVTVYTRHCGHERPFGCCDEPPSRLQVASRDRDAGRIVSTLNKNIEA